MVDAGRWLVVVDPARPHLYTLLRRRLTAQAYVLLDRRTQGEAPPPPPVERRHPMTPGEAMRWQTLGYHVAATAPTESAAAEDFCAEVDQLARLAYWFDTTRAVHPDPPTDDGRGPEASTAVLPQG